MPLGTTTGIEPAETTDVPMLASVLAHAFQDDPVFAWCIPDPTRRRARLPGVYAAFAEVFLPHEETYVTSDGVGAAMWAPAGVDPFDGERGERFTRRLAEILDPDDVGRCGEVAATFAEHHPPQPWMYLQLIGVLPEEQGRGRGSHLLEPVLRRCDAAGTPAYLEASTPGNRRLYARHGFVTTDEITLPDGGPKVWPMWREPAGR